MGSLSGGLPVASARRARRAEGSGGSAALIRSTHVVVGHQGHQVRLEEVAVVVGVFLGPQGVRAAVALVPVAGLLADLLARLEQVDLPAGLVVDGPAEGAQRVEVLDLAPRAVRLAGTVHAHVGVHPHRALLHLGVGRADGEEDQAQLVDVAAGLLAAADVRAAHDLDERHAGAVEVDQRLVAAVDPPAGPADVGRLAGVLLEVGPLDADPGAVGQVEPAVDVERDVVLADLVRLRHVRVEVVLAVERARLDAAVEGQPDAHRQLDGAAVEHRQSPREPERHRIDVGVGLVAEPVGLAENSFDCRRQLDVDLQSDDELVVRGCDGHRSTPAMMRASERQRASGQRRPAWPGNAMCSWRSILQ